MNTRAQEIWMEIPSSSIIIIYIANRCHHEAKAREEEKKIIAFTFTFTFTPQSIKKNKTIFFLPLKINS